MVILPISDMLFVLSTRPTKHEKNRYQFHFSVLHIDQHVLQNSLTYVAPHLSQRTPTGCIVVLQIASKHDVEDATRLQKAYHGATHTPKMLVTKAHIAQRELPKYHVRPPIDLHHNMSLAHAHKKF
jgi:hypothetical protein